MSALPITLIVYVLALTPSFDFTGTELITFTVGAVLQDAFAVPLSSVIGVNLYQFLSNNRVGRR